MVFRGTRATRSIGRVTTQGQQLLFRSRVPRCTSTVKELLLATGLPLFSLRARHPHYGHGPTKRSAPPVNCPARALKYNSHQAVLTTSLFRRPRAASCGTVGPWLVCLASQLISEAYAAGVMWVSECLDCSWPGNSLWQHVAPSVMRD